MSVIETTLGIWETSRERTLATLSAIKEHPHSDSILLWRPGLKRAHIMWQLMHVAVTEELFATERILGTASRFSEYIPRFRGGSVPDEDLVDLVEIERILTESRQDLINTVSTLSDQDLSTIPEPIRDRGWTLGKVLQIVTWHEAHHQGQAHLTWNLWRAQHSQ